MIRGRTRKGHAKEWEVNMKKSAGKQFVRSFIKSVFVVLILITVGASTYIVVTQFLNIPAPGAAEAFKQKEQVSITEAKVEDISKNLIYCVDEKTGEINKILLEIFHCGNKKLTYLTIPVRTQFTMTNTLYQELVPVNPAIPQIIKLSGITKYFDETSQYEYGVLLIEDLLKIKVSYYTVIGQSVYETMFVTEEIETAKEAEQEVKTSDGQEPDGQEEADRDETQSETQAAAPRSVPREVFSEDYITFLHTLNTAEAISNYIEDSYSSLQSNLTVTQKMNYLDGYSQTPIENVSFEVICGANQNSAYILDKEKTSLQIADYVGDDMDK
jgi:hypothetical protein